MSEIISLQKDMLSRMSVATGGSDELGGLKVVPAASGELGVLEAHCTAVLDFAFVLGRTEYANPYHQSCDHNQAFLGNRLVPHMFAWVLEWTEARIDSIRNKKSPAGSEDELPSLLELRAQLLRGDVPEADFVIADGHPESGMD